MEIQGNPCLKCDIDQQCCKAMGLKLSKREFEKNFKEYSARLSVVKYNEMYIVFPRNNLPCPYWQKDGCSIYSDRPVDCRLFPYELHRMVEKRHSIEVDMYDQTDCPHKEGLFMPVAEAMDLIKDLARDVYGHGKPVHVQYEPGKKPPRRFGIFDPLIARLSNLLRSYR